MAGLLLGVPTLAAALTVRPTAPVPTCWNQATSDVDRAACGAAEYAAANKELNGVYGELTAKTDPALRAPIRKAQRAWVAFRDAHVASIVGWNPGRTAGRSW